METLKTDAEIVAAARQQRPSRAPGDRVTIITGPPLRGLYSHPTATVDLDAGIVVRREESQPAS